MNDPAGYCTRVTGPPVNECDGLHQLNACDALDAPGTQLGTATGLAAGDLFRTRHSSGDLSVRTFAAHFRDTDCREAHGSAPGNQPDDGGEQLLLREALRL